MSVTSEEARPIFCAEPEIWHTKIGPCVDGPCGRQRRRDAGMAQSHARTTVATTTTRFWRQSQILSPTRRRHVEVTLRIDCSCTRFLCLKGNRQPSPTSLPVSKSSSAHLYSISPLPRISVAQPSPGSPQSFPQENGKVIPTRIADSHFRDSACVPWGSCPK